MWFNLNPVRLYSLHSRVEDFCGLSPKKRIAHVLAKLKSLLFLEYGKYSELITKEQNRKQKKENIKAKKRFALLSVKHKK